MIGQLNRIWGNKRRCQKSSSENRVLRAKENSEIETKEGRKGTGASGIIYDM